MTDTRASFLSVILGCNLSSPVHFLCLGHNFICLEEFGSQFSKVYHNQTKCPAHLAVSLASRSKSPFDTLSYPVFYFVFHKGILKYLVTNVQVILAMCQCSSYSFIRARSRSHFHFFHLSCFCLNLIT